MKKFITVLSYFLIGLNIQLIGYTPPVMDTHSIHLQCSELLNDSRTLRFKTHFFQSLVFLNDSIGYYNPNGTLHLFKIKFDSTQKVTLLRDAPYNGQNFNNHLFLYNEKLFSLGGSGLFNTSSSLLKYDFQKNEWFVVIKIEGLPKNTTNVISSWVYGDKLFVCYQFYDKEQKFSYGYIDLERFTYTQLNEFNTSSSSELATGRQGNIVHSSKDFLVFQSMGAEECRYDLFSLKNGAFIRNSFLKDKPCISGKSYVYTKDSTMYFRHENGWVDSMKLDQSTVFFKNNFNEFYLSKSLDRSNVIIWSLGTVVVALLVFLNFMTYRKWSEKRKALVEKEEGSIEIKHLFQVKGRSISRDELDAILEISHLSPESSKSQRSKLVKAINEQGKIKITRIRNQVDKRYYDYFIE